MLGIAVPIMLSNISTPLIGLVDTAVVGRIPDPAHIGAVAVGTLIFNSVFWLFAFLRMGTTAMTAQALGARDYDELRGQLGRALAIGLGMGVVIIALQWPIREIAFGLIDGSEKVESLARGYFNVRVWAAPATLANYALLGWFIGLGRTDIGFVLQLILNLTNIVLDVVLVLGFGLGVRGVAFGTICAEVFAAAIGITIALMHVQKLGGRWDRRLVLMPERLRRTVSVNFDILVRTLALVMAFAWFTARGAEQGDVILAANAVLMQFVMLQSYFLDGLAFSAESLVGRAMGAANREGLVSAAKLTTFWAVLIAIALTGLYALFGTTLVDVLTTDPEAREAARTYLPWAVAIPLPGVWAFQLDGIFIGATRTRDMRNAMVLSLAIYLLSWWILTPFGNHGLWAAFHVHYAARFTTLAWFFPRLVRSVPKSGEAGHMATST